MTGYLIDTSIALISLASPAKLRVGARAAIEKGPNFLSTITYWEVMLKCMKGKLDVGDPRTWWLDALDQLVATPLPLRPAHVSRIYQLPPIHFDPFDRVLIAQAIVEDVALVTADDEICNYAGEGFRVVNGMHKSS